MAQCYLLYVSREKCYVGGMKKTLVTLAAFTLGITGIAAPSQAAPAPVSFTLNFVGVPCEGCTVTWQNGVDVDDQGGGPQETIKNGSVTFTSDQGSMAPGSFSINNPKFGFIDAATIIVMRYKGKAVGSQVTRKKAVAAKRASSCWVGYNPVSNGGTDSPTENSMTIRLSTVKDKDMSGKTTKSILSWARPTATVKGQLMEKPSSKFLSASKGRILVNGDLACG